MKKNIFLILCFGILTISLKSQVLDYNSLVSYIQTNTKENTKDKIIAVNVWSVNNKISRDANIDLNNTAFIFKDAKLKNGSKGMIGIVICIDNDEVINNITLQKDGINTLIKINASQVPPSLLLNNKTAGYNVGFDSNGIVLFENLQNTTFLNSIRNLITR